MRSRKSVRVHRLPPARYWLLMDRALDLPGSLAAVIAATSAAVLFRIGPQTFLQDWYWYCSVMMSKGVPERPSRHMEGLLREVIAAMGISEEEAGRVQLYVTAMSEAMSWGSPSSASYGMTLGYPFYFHVDDHEKFNMERLRLGKLSAGLGWDGYIEKDQIPSKDAIVFKRSLALSDAAKRFVLARQLYRSRENIAWWQAFVSLGSGAVTYLTCRGLNKKMKMFARPLKHRLVLYFGVCLFMGLFALNAEDLMAEQADLKADRLACALGREYALGGVGYYNTMLSRHMVLRNLMPNDQGPNFYDLRGDIHRMLFRRYPTSIQKRRDECVKAKEKLLTGGGDA